MELGALDAETCKWTHPSDACKSKSYKCVECNEALIIKQGNVRKHHFSHFSKSECTYFDHPSESQIHKDAKYKLADLLAKRADVYISIQCRNSECRGYKHKIVHQNEDIVVIEYRDPKGTYVADVAIINNDGTPRYIFEVMNTHRTETQRPEPWFELDAKEICTSKIYDFDCIRKRVICNCCRAFSEKWLYNIPKLDVVDTIHHKPCISCETTKYVPVWKHGYRMICPTCIEYNIVSEDIKRLGIFGKCVF
jgi:hypothetical protein